jgi:hypothetical protein
VTAEKLRVRDSSRQTSRWAAISSRSATPACQPSLLAQASCPQRPAEASPPAQCWQSTIHRGAMYSHMAAWCPPKHQAGGELVPAASLPNKPAAPSSPPA